VATLEAIEEEDLLKQAAEVGQYTQEKLRALKDKHSAIDHVRGIGMMIGIQMTRPGAEIVSACLEKGLRINCTHDTVIRFMPPMIATTAEIDQAIDIFDSVLSES